MQVYRLGVGQVTIVVHPVESALHDEPSGPLSVRICVSVTSLHAKEDSANKDTAIRSLILFNLFIIKLIVIIATERLMRTG